MRCQVRNVIRNGIHNLIYDPALTEKNMHYGEGGIITELLRPGVRFTRNLKPQTGLVLISVDTQTVGFSMGARAGDTNLSASSHLQPAPQVRRRTITRKRRMREAMKQRLRLNGGPPGPIINMRVRPHKGASTPHRYLPGVLQVGAQSTRHSTLVSAGGMSGF